MAVNRTAHTSFNEEPLIIRRFDPTAVDRNEAANRIDESSVALTSPDASSTAEQLSKRSKRKKVKHNTTTDSTAVGVSSVTITEGLARLFEPTSQINATSTKVNTKQVEAPEDASDMKHAVKPNSDVSVSLKKGIPNEKDWILSLFDNKVNLKRVEDVSTNLAKEGRTYNTATDLDKHLINSSCIPFSPSLQSAVYPFYRTGTDEEIELQWRVQRQKLTVAYKTVHKGATRKSRRGRTNRKQKRR